MRDRQGEGVRPGREGRARRDGAVACGQAELDRERRAGRREAHPGEWRPDQAVAAAIHNPVFGNALVNECRRDERVIGITAAMNSGTGLNILQRELPERYYDVGIAEQQAVLFAAGLALQGCKPVAAIYSTFLQRAFDQIVHDVCLQKLNVVFAMDRAGLVGDDGPTHHGMFDIAYLRCLPNIVLMAPRDEAMLVHMLRTALAYDDGPVGLRYPRGAGVGAELPAAPARLLIGTGEILREGDRVALLGYGAGVQKALGCGVAAGGAGHRGDCRRRALLQAARRRARGAARGRARAAGHGRGRRARRRLWVRQCGRHSRTPGSPRRESCESGCPTGTSRTDRRSCCTRRSGSPASGSPSGSRRRSPSSANTLSDRPPFSKWNGPPVSARRWHSEVGFPEDVTSYSLRSGFVRAISCQVSPTDLIKKFLHHAPTSVDACRHYEGDLTNFDVAALRANVPPAPTETLDLLEQLCVFTEAKPLRLSKLEIEKVKDELFTTDANARKAKKEYRQAHDPYQEASQGKGKG